MMFLLELHKNVIYSTEHCCKVSHQIKLQYQDKNTLQFYLTSRLFQSNKIKNFDVIIDIISDRDRLDQSPLS